MTQRALEGGVGAARGWRAGTAACGIKEATNGDDPVLGKAGRDDLAVVCSDRVCDVGGVFTQNKVKSASVIIDQLHLKRNRVQGFVVCSGNANACTGGQGFRDALQMAKATADRLDLDPDQVLVATTGVIGRYLPMKQVKAGIDEACAQLTPEAGLRAAAAIMTTDTVPKTAGLEVDLPSGATVRIGGMAKGSGMI
ncbi:MAG: bifunctional ornithine acetyltransferase/N-acetylglutamate synthase, partial [Candidatus Dormibacteraceae bacterium]